MLLPSTITGSARNVRTTSATATAAARVITQLKISHFQTVSFFRCSARCFWLAILSSRERVFLSSLRSFFSAFSCCLRLAR